MVEWDRYEGQVIDIRGTKFDLYYKEFESGEVVLGGNCGSAEDNMYVILIEPLEAMDSELQDLPGYFTILQNYPNPFNPETTIKFNLPVAARISLRIYNILGQRIITLEDGEMPAGFYEIRWDGTNQNRQTAASGTYIYQISAQSIDGQQRFTQSRRMILMR